MPDFYEIDYNFVSKWADTDMASGFKLKTTDELAAIPRRHAKFPFCHPGPIPDGTFYADSVLGIREAF